MIRGLDISHHQRPELFDWDAVAKNYGFVIARASYGAKTRDRNFVQFANRAWNHKIPFGAYHFYRQIHTVTEQLALFYEQLRQAPSEGMLVPTLDMEENSINGDGRPRPKHFSDSCRAIAEDFVDHFGGCILYYSSYFPEYLKGHTEWMKDEHYVHWLADYNREGGDPRTPYTDTWVLHQPRPHKIPEYDQGRTVIDVDYLHPDADVEGLRTDRVGFEIDKDARDGEAGTTERPGGALPDDFDDGISAAHEGAQLLADGLAKLKRS